VRDAIVAIVAVMQLIAFSGPALLAEEPAKGPRIAVEPPAFDFGKALPNKSLHKDFTIRNFGSEDLEIERVTTTCGCTAALADNKVVKPGESTTLRVTLQTRDYKGRVEREILVQSNDPAQNPLKLKVQATVVAGGE